MKNEILAAFRAATAEPEYRHFEGNYAVLSGASFLLWWNGVVR